MIDEEIFLAAIDLASPGDRTAYLEKVCGRDIELRHRVEVLLAAHFKSGSFLDEPLGQQMGSDPKPPAHDQFKTRVANRRGDDDPDEGGSGDEEPADLRFLSPPTRPDSLGRIGHYEVLQVVGQGGFGIVLRAFDEVLHRVVALKVLAPAIAATSPARKRFVREARSYAQVRHENVVQVHAVEERPLPYLVMEFVPGETLQQRLDRTGPLDALEIVQLGRQIAEGLAASHATGLIHRDIKPGNVLIEGENPRVKLTDFGLARTADDASLTQSGTVVGTPMYMAPEQVKGEPLDHRSDLFSLGSVLYQMATGRPPFRAATTFAVLKRVVEDDPRPIRDVIPEIPQWLADVIAKLHAKNPEERFQSAREVADVLTDCETRLKGNVNAVAPIAPNKPAAGRSGRWKWIAAVAVLAPVIALALTEVTGVTHWLRSPTPDPLKNDDGERARNDLSTKTGRPSEHTNTLGMKLRLIPAGKFTMGASQAEVDRCLKAFGENDWAKVRLLAEGFEHEVEITQPFYMGTTEVTVGQFRQFLEAENYTVGEGGWKKPGSNEIDDYPAVFLFWHNAVDFCKWLSEKEGKHYRLPTEAEWEYCCRAGRAGTRYGFGDIDELLDEYAWYSKNAGDGNALIDASKPNPGGRMRPVGKLKPNAWGLHDMHGNAWEWCRDNYDPDYYKNSPLKDPLCIATEDRGGGLLHGSNLDHVLRGGSCHWSPVFCRSTFRHNVERTNRYDDIGFRVVLVPSP